jgi:hypothetical protein
VPVRVAWQLASEHEPAPKRGLGLVLVLQLVLRGGATWRGWQLVQPELLVQLALSVPWALLWLD